MLSMIFDFLSYYRFYFFGVCILIWTIFSFKKNGNFLTAKEVVFNHLSIFKDDKSQYILFYILPFILAFGIISVDTISESVTSSIVVVLSILLTMLFTLMGTLVSSNCIVKKNIKELVKQTVHTLLYEAFICIIELLLCLVVLFFNKYEVSLPLVIISLIIYYLMVHIALNIFLIIQRIGVLFSELTE